MKKRNNCEGKPCFLRETETLSEKKLLECLECLGKRTRDINFHSVHMFGVDIGDVSCYTIIMAALAFAGNDWDRFLDGLDNFFFGDHGDARQLCEDMGGLFYRAHKVGEKLGVVVS